MYNFSPYTTQHGYMPIQYDNYNTRSRCFFAPILGTLLIGGLLGGTLGWLVGRTPPYGYGFQQQYAYPPPYYPQYQPQPFPQQYQPYPQQFQQYPMYQQQMTYPAYPNYATSPGFPK